MVLSSAVVAAAVLASTALCGTAAAAEGVHFDPESPAGKEYALPLSQARNEGAGKTGVSKNGTVEPAPLFGEGVSAPPGGAGSAQGTATSPGTAHHEGGATGGGTKPPGETGGGSAGESDTGVGSSSNNGYSTGSGILLIAAVIAAGLALGLGLRQVRRPRPS